MRTNEVLTSPTAASLLSFFNGGDDNPFVADAEQVFCVSTYSIINVGVKKSCTLQYRQETWRTKQWMRTTTRTHLL